MLNQQSIQFIRSVYDAFNNKDLNKLVGFYNQDAQFKLVAFDNKTFNGPSEIRQMHEGWFKAFPDLKLELTKVLNTDEGVVVEMVGRGTHKGTFSTPLGEIAPTNQKIEAYSCDVIKITNGKIAAVDCYLESGALLQQLGAWSLKAAA